MDSRTVMPFGKYRGQSLTVARRDRQYCSWLCSQEWFAEKFPALHRRLRAEPTTAGRVVPWDAVAHRFGGQAAAGCGKRRKKAAHEPMEAAR